MKVQILEARGHDYNDSLGRCNNCGSTYWAIVNLIALGRPATCLGQVKPLEEAIKEAQPSMRRTRVYIAGPYSQGDPETNVKRAIDAADALLARGYAPFIPHLTHYWHQQHKHPYETWMQLDLEWVATCDCLLRLEGPSTGADREVVHATNHKIPVYLSLDTLVACQPYLTKSASG